MPLLETTRTRTPAFNSRRLHLLEAAARVFSVEGHDRASTWRIAAEAQLSPSGIYHLDGYIASASGDDARGDE